MPRYQMWHPATPGAVEPPTADDRWYFYQAGEDAQNIVRRHVHLLTTEQGMAVTKAWKLAMADHRLVWPLPHTTGVHAVTTTTGSGKAYAFKCDCGWEETNTDLTGIKRSRRAHHEYHVKLREADRALVESMKETTP